jgi:chitin disaccharide deacetylase
MPTPTDIRHAAGPVRPDPAREHGGQTGLLIVNADDWGRTAETTDRTAECVSHGVVSAVSAMVFMEDAERAAALAREHGIEAGLHLNFTTPFSGPRCPERLRTHQQALSRALRRGRFALVAFYPRLVRSFEYAVRAQVDEFTRLYGRSPIRFDGHHHMHLCTNVLIQRLLPAGAIVRRSFSFEAGEKGWTNRMYRRVVDHALSRRYRVLDRFFSLSPLEPASRRQRIFAAARRLMVEVETHPVEPGEYRFLTSERWTASARGLRIVAPSAVPWGSPDRAGRS